MKEMCTANRSWIFNANAVAPVAGNTGGIDSCQTNIVNPGMKIKMPRIAVGRRGAIAEGPVIMYGRSTVWIKMNAVWIVW